jgi:predicted short-subunit dehydrogenase-like oxidoreductase (DUF2520 family)
MENRSGAPAALTIVGSGRAGSSIAAAAGRSGIEVIAAGRDFGPDEVSGHCVLLCVPDAEIAAAAAKIQQFGASPYAVGHVSGATRLGPLSGAGPAAGTFSMHPLQTIPTPDTDLSGAHAAVSGSTPDMLALATGLAEALGMHPFEVREEDRGSYHAAASIASNFLVALEQTAADLLDRIGVEQPREVLAPLVRRSLENWIAGGPGALTGPIARGDRVTVDRHREALAATAPEMLALYDTMAGRTAALAGASEVAR